MAEVTQPEILAAMARHAPCSAKQLAAFMGVHATRLGACMTRLRDPQQYGGKRIYVVEWKRGPTGHQFATYDLGNHACAKPLPTVAGGEHQRRKVEEMPTLLVASVFDLCGDMSKLHAIVRAIDFSSDPFPECDE